MVKNARAISTSTQFCAVIGNPIAHSLSPAIHNAAYAELGLDFVYVACLVEDVKNALAGMRALGNFRGMSVTIPHKIESMKHVDEVASVDRAIGSVNTIVKEKGRLVAFGTDGPGALKAMADAEVDVGGKRILMLGAGGAARAIAFTLARNAKPGQLSLLDIDEGMLGPLASDLRAGTDVPIDAGLLDQDSLARAIQGADMIIHCTPVGMHPNQDASLIRPELFRPEQVVFDIVYTPLETKLLADAKSCGLKVIHGIDMFVSQAVLQFERVTGADAPVEVMRRVVMENLAS